MQTVYGIYIDGRDEPIYIGCTSLFRARKHNHFGTAPSVLRNPKAGPRVKFKALIMQMARLGDIKVTITPIAVFGKVGKDARVVERRLIERLSPPLNSVHTDANPHLRKNKKAA